MCDKAADACFSALKFIPDWLVTTKVLGILNNVLWYRPWSCKL